MPDNLKALLVDDWENVTKNLQVVALPAKFTVNQILDHFYEEEKPKRTTPSDLDVLDEVIAGIREYFDKSLDKILLYRFEREQYKLLRKKNGDLGDKSPLDIYGAEHLTRLFGKKKILPISNIAPRALISNSIMVENGLLIDFPQLRCPSSSLRPTWTSSPPTGFVRNSPRLQPGLAGTRRSTLPPDT